MQALHIRAHDFVLLDGAFVVKFQRSKSFWVDKCSGEEEFVFTDDYFISISVKSKV